MYMYIDFFHCCCDPNLSWTHTISAVTNTNHIVHTYTDCHPYTYMHTRTIPFAHTDSHQPTNCTLPVVRECLAIKDGDARLVTGKVEVWQDIFHLNNT